MFLIPPLGHARHKLLQRANCDGNELRLPMFIAYGITGVRDMGSDSTRFFAPAASCRHQRIGHG